MRRILERHVVLLAWLLVSAVFVLDLQYAHRFNALLLYNGVILLGLWAPRAALALELAAAASLLGIAGYLAPGPSSQLLEALNRALGIIVVWVTAAGVTVYRQSGARHEAARRGLVADLERVKYALDQSAIVAMTDVQGTITYVNDKFCEISRYSREELIGRNHRILNSGLHPPEFFRDMYRTIAGGRVWRDEIRNRAKDGTLYWVDTTIVPFLDERGRPYQYVAIRYDITERKRTDAALRAQAALAQLGKMAAVVAHEVRNPLAGIRGALQVIGPRLPAGSRERGIVDEVVARVDALNDIVRDLLIFARPQSPSLARVDIGLVLRDTLALVREDRSFEHVLTSIHSDGIVLQADAHQLKLVFHNLLLNAAQAMTGRGTVVIAARAEDGWCEVRIADSGPGVPEDVREHLFEPFFTTKHQGTGLGLATARRIIEAHGGTIALESQPGGGTVAIVRLPAGSADRPRRV